MLFMSYFPSYTHPDYDTYQYKYHTFGNWHSEQVYIKNQQRNHSQRKSNAQSNVLKYREVLTMPCSFGDSIPWEIEQYYASYYGA